MEEATVSPRSASVRWLRAGAGSLAAGFGAVASVSLAASGAEAARASWGEEAMLLWTMASLAIAAAVLCAYLTVIWLLAAIALASGPGGLLGRASLKALRVLAPRLAHRVLAGAAVATAVTGLALGPAQAREPDTGHDHRPGVAARAELPDRAVPPANVAGMGVSTRFEGHLPVDTTGAGVTSPTPSPEPVSSAETAPVDASGDDASSLPPLGWAEPQAPDASASPAAPPREVIVHDGDCLWSIADELLGPGRDTDSAIDATWPLLYKANASAIGSDPDVVATGQRLVVPADLPSPSPDPRPAAQIPAPQEKS